MTVADNMDELHELYAGLHEIKEDLEDVIISFELLQENVRLAIEEISEDLESIQRRLQKRGCLFHGKDKTGPLV